MKPSSLILVILLLIGAVFAHGASVTLAHNANTDAVTKGYFVYAFTNGVPAVKQDVALSTTNTITGLLNSTTYVFYVTAYDANKKESLPSNTVVATTPAAPALPAVPAAPGVAVVKNATSGFDVNVSWPAVAGAASYQVQTINALTGVVVSTLTSSGTALTVSALAPGQYTFSVRSVNVGGASAFGAGTTVIILTTPVNARVITVSP